jgi:hypothetical protein
MRERERMPAARATRRPWSRLRFISAPANTTTAASAIFIDMHKEGAALRSFINNFAIAVFARPAIRRAAR